MTCDQIYELLSAKLDGALSEEEQTQLQAHLDACADCRRLYDAMFVIEAQTKALETPAPEGLKRGVMYKIRQESGAVKSGKRRFWGVGTGLGLVAAALVMMVGAGIIKLPRPVRSEPRTEDRSAYYESNQETSALKGALASNDDRYLSDQTRNDSASEPMKELQPEITANPAGRPQPLPPEPNESNDAPEQASRPAFEDNIGAEDASQQGRDPETEAPGNTHYGQYTPESPVSVTQPHVGGDSNRTDDPELPQAQPVTEALNEACMALSLQSEVPVVLYTEFSWPSLMVLLEEAEPELFEALAVAEPVPYDEAMKAAEEGEPASADPKAEAVAPPVVPDSAMPAPWAGFREADVPPEQRMLVCSVDWQTALALQEWLLRMMPRSEDMDFEELRIEADTYIRMEELDPEQGCLNRIVTWDRPTGPISWPEFWAEDWAARFRKSENWALFFPEEEYLPAPEEPARLVFLLPTAPEPVEFPHGESEPEP